MNEHLQSNDQIATKGVWNGYMVVLRLVVDRRRNRRTRNANNNVPVENAIGDDVILEGRGKVESYLNKLGLFEVDVKDHCLSHAVLLGMSLNDKSELYKAFMAGFNRYLKVVLQEQLVEIENSCEILSKIGGIRKYSMKRIMVSLFTRKEMK